MLAISRFDLGPGMYIDRFKIMLSCIGHILLNPAMF